MDTHFSNLSFFVPDLLSRRMLDLGSGRGKFLVDIARRGGDVVGYEKSPTYVELSRKRLSDEGLVAEVMQGEGEALPFEDGAFGFINMSEVIEHVTQPEAVLREAFRVLSKGGAMYVSAPSRYSMKDPHYHLYGVNWLPRKYSGAFVGMFGKTKTHNGEAGGQSLEEMHYYTKEQFEALAESIGFEVRDTRVEKIACFGQPKQTAYRTLYSVMHPWYFDAYHFICIKP